MFLDSHPFTFPSSHRLSGPVDHPPLPTPSPHRPAQEHLPPQASDGRSIRTVREKNAQPPLANALNVLFRLFVHVLEIEDGDNKNHASLLGKMSKYIKA